MSSFKRTKATTSSKGNNRVPVGGFSSIVLGTYNNRSELSTRQMKHPETHLPHNNNNNFQNNKEEKDSFLLFRQKKSQKKVGDNSINNPQNNKNNDEDDDKVQENNNTGNNNYNTDLSDSTKFSKQDQNEEDKSHYNISSFSSSIHQEVQTDQDLIESLIQDNFSLNTSFSDNHDHDHHHHHNNNNNQPPFSTMSSSLSIDELQITGTTIANEDRSMMTMTSDSNTMSAVPTPDLSPSGSSFSTPKLASKLSTPEASTPSTPKSYGRYQRSHLGIHHSRDSSNMSNILSGGGVEDKNGKYDSLTPRSTSSSRRSSVMGTILYGKGEMPAERSPSKRMFPQRHNQSSICFGDDGGSMGLPLTKNDSNGTATTSVSSSSSSGTNDGSCTKSSKATNGGAVDSRFKGGLPRKPQQRGSQIVFGYPQDSKNNNDNGTLSQSKKMAQEDKKKYENIVHGVPSGFYGVR